MPFKDFAALDRAAADAYLQAHVARADARLEAFRAEVAATGGPPVESLDGSPESLPGVWRWFVARRGGPGELPPWYEPDPPGLEGERLSASALQDVDGIALYLALAFRRALGPLEWGLGLEDPRKHYVSQHRPVLKAPGYDIDTLLVSYNLAMRTLEGRDTDDEALLRTLRAWTG